MPQAVFALLAVFLLLVTGAIARAGDKEKAVIEAAIKAHGGAEKIAKCKMGRVKTEGTLATPLGDAEFTQEETFELPGKLRREVRMKAKDQEMTFLFVSDGENSWTRRGDGPVQTIAPQKPALAKSALEGHWSLSVAKLGNLLEKGVVLSPLKDEKINDRAALGIKVEVDGQWQNDLYFDKADGRLVKTVKSAPKPGVPEIVRTETVFDDYKEAGGVQIPRKITAYQDGKKTMTVKVTEVKFLDKVDVKTFAKP